MENEGFEQKHGVPALLSFFVPGLGQIVKGQIGKGILIFFGMIISVILCFFLVGFITTPILWLWNVYDAYNSNPKPKISKEKPNPKHSAKPQETKPQAAKKSDESNYAKIALLALVVILIIGGIFIMAGKATPGNETKAKRVLLETNLGNITIELYSFMPITAGNFEKLVNKGFYNGTIIHRVIPDFMIQGGDPTGTGRGGPGYVIQDEFINGSTNLRGTIAMANSGPNSGGSQFFINLMDNTYLDWDKPPMTSRHPVFGKIVEGMDVVDKIGSVQTDSSDRPVKDVIIIGAKVI